MFFLVQLQSVMTALMTIILYVSIVLSQSSQEHACGDTVFSHTLLWCCWCPCLSYSCKNYPHGSTDIPLYPAAEYWDCAQAVTDITMSSTFSPYEKEDAGMTPLWRVTLIERSLKGVPTILTGRRLSPAPAGDLVDPRTLEFLPFASRILPFVKISQPLMPPTDHQELLSPYTPLTLPISALMRAQGAR